MKRVQFSQLPISEETKRAVTDMGFEEATSIQTQAIPLILDGHDVIGHSQTGTGKTAAFGIPIIERISTEAKGATQALVLCPTRELAIQACEEMRKFAKYKHGIRVVPVYGGQPIDRQIKTLKMGAEIVIGTPGRVMDHMRRHTLKLKNLTMIVLDEADEMLNMGFREDIETILQDVPAERQTILFSATMPPEIMRITHQYQKNPQIVKTVRHELTVPNIKQYCYEVPPGQKTAALSRLLDYYNPHRSLVFCNTKRMVDELLSELQFRGYSPAGLHGDMKQPERTTVMNAFKAGKIDILIATDVAARGIDVEDIDAVFNYDLPQDEEYYVHRIGRTGRAGKTGTSYTFISGRKQIYALRDIERYIKHKIELRPIPSMDEVQGIRNDKLLEQVTEMLKKQEFRKYEFLVDKLLEQDFTSVEIACAALQLLAEDVHEGALLDQAVELQKKPVTAKYGVEGKNIASARVKAKRTNFEKFSGPMTRLIVSVGKKDRVAANHIVAAIAGASGLPGSIIGSIDVHDNYTFVEVPKDSVDIVLRAMTGCIINGRVSKTEIVKNVKRARPKNQS